MKNKYINFEIENAEVIEEDPDSQFATAKIQAFASDKNRHDMICSEEVLQKTAPTIYDKPILYNVNKMFDDFGTHTDPDKSLIAGFVASNSASFERLPDSRLALNVLAKIWKRYAPKVIDYFKRDGGSKKVSVEMELHDFSERDDGLTEMLDFSYSGIALLGDIVTEASPGANIQILSFAEENAEFEKAKELEFGKYDEVDFKIPKRIKENAQLALDLFEEHGLAGSSGNLAHARFLANNDSITPEKVRKMFKVLSGKEKVEMGDGTTPSSNYIAYMMWGGMEGMKWANKICNMLDECDSRTVSYFSGNDDPMKKEENFVEDEKVKEEEKTEEMAVEETSKEEEKSEEKQEEKKEEMAAETKEEEKQEEHEKGESEEEEKKEEMSLDANLDVAAALAFLQAETESYQALVAEFSEGGSQDYAKLAYALYAKGCEMAASCHSAESEKEEMCNKMAQMAEECKAHMAENEELRKFKAEKDEEKFNFAVDSTLKAIEEKVQIPGDELEVLREKAKEFSLETLNAWENLAKARGLDFAAKEKTEDGQPKRYGLIWGNTKQAEKKSLWDRLG